MSYKSKYNEISVYVINETQPFENWSGIYRYFKIINGVSGFYVENSNGILVKVDRDLIFESDTNLNISEFIKMHRIYNNLYDCELCEEDSIAFIKILNKIKLPEKWINIFNKELKNPDSIPFEGGICFNEALVALKMTIQ